MGFLFWRVYKKVTMVTPRPIKLLYLTASTFITFQAEGGWKSFICFSANLVAENQMRDRVVAERQSPGHSGGPNLGDRHLRSEELKSALASWRQLGCPRGLGG